MLAFLVAWGAACLRLAGATQLLRSATNNAEGNFIYDYSKHGQDWMMGQCSSRQRQSPVDFLAAHASAPASGKFSVSYNKLQDPFEFVNNGHSFSADLRGMGLGGIARDNVWYEVMYLNVHAMGEHTIDGVRKPAELHIVHKRYDSDALLIVAIPLDSATPPPAGGTPLSPAGQPYVPPPLTDPNYNDVIQALLRVRPPPVNFKVGVPGSQVGAPDLTTLIESTAFMEYAGSTTAPPCAESAIWLVRTKPVMASDTQLRYLRDAVYSATGGFGNWRAAMPLGGRTVAVRFPIIEDPPVMRSEEPNVPAVQTPAISREFRSLKWAKDALRLSRASMDYVRDLDARVHAAANAQANGLAPAALPALQPANPMWAYGGMPGPAPGPAPAPAPCPQTFANSEQAAINMANTIKTAAQVAVAQATQVVAQQAKAAATQAAQNAADMVLQELRLKNPHMVSGR